MATLTSKLVISLVDQVSGPARGMLAQLKAVQAAARTTPMAALATEGKRFGAATQRFSAAVSTPLGIGMAALIQSTQEFEKSLVGVQIAGIADNLQDGVVNFGKLRSEAEATKQEALALSEALRLNPDGLLKAGEAAAKMGLPAKNLATLMKMSGSVNVQDHSLSPDQAAEFLGSMGINFKAGDKAFERGGGSGDYNADITKLANQLLGVAHMTRTSAGRLQEGLRQFAPLYAGFGVTFAEASSMIGAMVQAGQLDTESGTALRSLGVRMLAPTAQGREAMLKADIDRSQFMDLSAVSGGKAFGDLMKLTDVRLKAKQRDALKAKLVEGEKGKKFLDEGWQQEFLRMYNDATGAKTAEAREANMERVLMSLTTGGGKVDMFGFMKMLADKMEKGELTDAQMSKLAEGRHLSKYKALFALMPKMLELFDKAKNLKSEYTDNGTQLWRDSSAGRWQGALASMNRAFIRLRESEGITNLIDSLSRLGEAIARAPAGAVEALGKALVGLAVIGPVGLAISGAAAGITAIGAAARLAAIPVLLLLTRLRGAGAASVAANAAAAASAAPLFGMGRHTAASKSANAGASSRMIAGMGANAQTSQRMVLGMSAAGQAAAAVPPGIGARFMSMAAGIGRVVLFAARLTLVAGAISGIAAAGLFIAQNWQGLGAFFSGFASGFTKALEPLAPMIQPIVDGAMTLAGWLTRITGPLDESGQKWRSWGETAGAAVGTVVMSVVDLVAWIGRLVDTLSFGLAGKAGNWIAGKLGLGERPSDHLPKLSLLDVGRPPAPSGQPASGQGAAGSGTAPAAAGPTGANADLSGVNAQAQTIVVSVRSAMDQVRGIVSQTVGEMQALGLQAAEQFAAGIRAGTPAITDAASSAMGAATRGALRGSFSDGGR